MRISDWSSDVCSSDLGAERLLLDGRQAAANVVRHRIGAADIDAAFDRFLFMVDDLAQEGLADAIVESALGEQLLGAEELRGLGDHVDRKRAVQGQRG